MSKPSRGQVLSAIGILANNTDWDAIRASTLQRIIDDPKGSGRRFTELLNDVRRTGEVTALQLDPKGFIGEGWSYAEPCHPDSAMFSVMRDSYNEVLLSMDWQQGEKVVSGDIRRKRILGNSKFVPLNADHFLYLWTNKKKIPKEWEQEGRFITFDGDLLEDKDGKKHVLYLVYHRGCWRWGHRPIDYSFENYRAAVFKNTFGDWVL